MNIAVLTFTYWRDAHRAYALHKNIPATYRAINGVEINITPIWVVESVDKELPALANKLAGNNLIKTIVLDFDRGRGLSGVECVQMMSRLYVDLFSRYGYDAVLKIDADSIVYDLPFVLESFARNIDLLGAFRFYNEQKAPNGLNGCFYAFSKRFIPQLLDNTLKAVAIKKIDDYCPEDLFFTFIFRGNAKARILHLDKHKWSMCCKPYLNADALGGHFGYISNERICNQLNAVNNARKQAKMPEISFDKNDFDIFIAEQNKVNNNRKIEPYTNLYDENGNDLKATAVPAGSVLLGYDSQGKPHWQFPQTIQSLQGLTPYAPEDMKRFGIVLK